MVDSSSPNSGQTTSQAIAGRLLKVGADLWICSYSLLAAVALNLLVRGLPQGRELTTDSGSGLLGFAQLTSSDHGAWYLFPLMALAVLYCALCIELAGTVSVEGKTGEIASTVPLWLALLTILSSANLFLTAAEGVIATILTLVLLPVIAIAHQSQPEGWVNWFRVPPNHRWQVIIALLVVGASLGVLTTIQGQSVVVPRFLTTWVVVYVAVGFWTLTGSVAFIYFPRSRGYPSFWLAPFVVVVLCSIWNDNHYVSETPCDRTVAKGRLQRTVDFKSHLLAWMANKEHCSTTESTCLVRVLAIEGGGSRAAYWTTAVLAQLDKKTATTRPFRKSVFAASSVSGGSLGAAIYFTAAEVGLSADDARTIAGADYLAPIVSSLVYGNAAQWLIPWPISALDRAIPFEESLSRSWAAKFAQESDVIGAASRRFDGPFPPLRSDGPLLFMNSTNVESGRRFVISPVVLDEEYRRGAYYAFDRTEPYCIAALPTKTAIHLSARFSFVNPIGALYEPPRDSKKRGRFWAGWWMEATSTELVLLRPLTLWTQLKRRALTFDAPTRPSLE